MFRPPVRRKNERADKTDKTIVEPVVPKTPAVIPREDSPLMNGVTLRGKEDKNEYKKGNVAHSLNKNASVRQHSKNTLVGLQLVLCKRL